MTARALVDNRAGFYSASMLKGLPSSTTIIRLASSSTMIQRLALFLVIPTLIAACGQSPSGLEPVTLTEAQLKLYEQSCKNCHGMPGNPAPQAGDAAAWAPRDGKGLETLVKNGKTA